MKGIQKGHLFCQKIVRKRVRGCISGRSIAVNLCWVSPGFVSWGTNLPRGEGTSATHKPHAARFHPLPFPQPMTYSGLPWFVFVPQELYQRSNDSDTQYCETGPTVFLPYARKLKLEGCGHWSHNGVNVCLYLHGQTGRFTDWTNGKKTDSGLVNCIPESSFPFAQMSSLFLAAVFHLLTSNRIFPKLFETSKQLMSRIHRIVN